MMTSLKFVKDLVVNSRHRISCYIDPDKGNQLIVKSLVHSTATDETRAAIKREYEIASLLRGEFHVNSLALEEKEGNPAIIYEDIGGVSLDKELQQGPLKLDAFFRLQLLLSVV